MPREKDNHANHNHVLEGLSPDMIAFQKELATMFPSIRYTSGKRSVSDNIGKASKTSHHNTGNALDFSAEHKEVYEYLSNTQEGLGLLSKYGLGIIDETDPETMKKTGATGPHFHIGKDSYYANLVKEKYKSFGEPIPINRIELISSPQTFELITENGQTLTSDLSALEQSVSEAKEREQEIGEKKEESPARKEIERKQQERQELASLLSQTQTPVEYFDPEEQEQGIPISQIEIIPVQTSLPDLPNINVV